MTDVIRAYKLLKSGAFGGQDWLKNEYQLMDEKSSIDLVNSGWAVECPMPEYQDWVSKLRDQPAIMAQHAAKIANAAASQVSNVVNELISMVDRASNDMDQVKNISDGLTKITDEIKTEMAKVRSEHQHVMNLSNNAINKINGLAKDVEILGSQSDIIVNLKADVKKMHDSRDYIIQTIESNERKIAALTPPECDNINAEFIKRLSGTFKCIIGDTEYEFVGGDNLSAIDGNMTIAFRADKGELNEGGDLTWHPNIDLFTWPDVNNNDIPMDIENMVYLGVAAASFQDKLRRASWKLQNADVLPDDYTSDRHWN